MSPLITYIVSCFSTVNFNLLGYNHTTTALFVPVNGNEEDTMQNLLGMILAAYQSCCFLSLECRFYFYLYNFMLISELALVSLILDCGFDEN